MKKVLLSLMLALSLNVLAGYTKIDSKEYFEAIINSLTGRLDRNDEYVQQYLSQGEYSGQEGYQGEYSQKRLEAYIYSVLSDMQLNYSDDDMNDIVYSVAIYFENKRTDDYWNQFDAERDAAAQGGGAATDPEVAPEKQSDYQPDRILALNHENYQDALMILGLNDGEIDRMGVLAAKKAIHRAYLKLSKIYHPDRHADDLARSTQSFAHIRNARDYLHENGVLV